MRSKSKRERLIYFCFAAWLILGLAAIYANTKQAGISFSELAAYIAALSPFVIGYIYGETQRPSTKGQKNGQ